MPEGGAALAERISLRVDGSARKGDQTPWGQHETDVLQFGVSRADFDDLPTQFERAAAYLAEHEADVTKLAAAGDAVLDFGHEPRAAALGGIQHDALPRELVRWAAKLNVQIKLSLYLFETYDDEEAGAEPSAV